MSELIVDHIDGESQTFKTFIEMWGDEIEEIFPHFSEDDAKYGEVLTLTYHGKTVGLFVYQFKGEELHVDVDYVTPSFRNLGIGQRFFKEKIDEFKKMGFKAIVTLSSNKTHQEYLASCGFEQQSKHPDWYQLQL